jgi:hypothetical protein
MVATASYIAACEYELTFVAPGMYGRPPDYGAYGAPPGMGKFAISLHID